MSFIISKTPNSAIFLLEPTSTPATLLQDNDIYNNIHEFCLQDGPRFLKLENFLKVKGIITNYVQLYYPSNNGLLLFLHLTYKIPCETVIDHFCQAILKSHHIHRYVSDIKRFDETGVEIDTSEVIPFSECTNVVFNQKYEKLKKLLDYIKMFSKCDVPRFYDFQTDSIISLTSEEVKSQDWKTLIPNLWYWNGTHIIKNFQDMMLYFDKMGLSFIENGSSAIYVSPLPYSCYSQFKKEEFDLWCNQLVTILPIVISTSDVVKIANEDFDPIVDSLEHFAKKNIRFKFHSDVLKKRQEYHSSNIAFGVMIDTKLDSKGIAVEDYIDFSEMSCFSIQDEVVVFYNEKCQEMNRTALNDPLLVALKKMKIPCYVKNAELSKQNDRIFIKLAFKFGTCTCPVLSFDNVANTVSISSDTLSTNLIWMDSILRHQFINLTPPSTNASDVLIMSLSAFKMNKFVRFVELCGNHSFNNLIITIDCKTIVPLKLELHYVLDGNLVTIVDDKTSLLTFNLENNDNNRSFFEKCIKMNINRHLLSHQFPIFNKENRLVNFCEQEFELDDFCQKLQDGHFGKIRQDALIAYGIYLKKKKTLYYSRYGNSIYVSGLDESITLDQFNDPEFKAILGDKFADPVPLFTKLIECDDIGSPSSSKCETFVFDVSSYKYYGHSSVKELMDRFDKTRINPNNCLITFEGMQKFVEIFCPDSNTSLVCAVDHSLANKINSYRPYYSFVLQTLQLFEPIKIQFRPKSPNDWECSEIVFINKQFATIAFNDKFVIPFPHIKKLFKDCEFMDIVD